MPTTLDTKKPPFIGYSFSLLQLDEVTQLDVHITVSLYTQYEILTLRSLQVAA